MAEQTTRKAWVDRYVRDEMMVDEIAEYETALMESPGMQRELETVLGLREAFFLQSQQNPATGNRLAEPVYGARGWQPLSLTATVILALFSTAICSGKSATMWTTCSANWTCSTSHAVRS